MSTDKFQNKYRSKSARAPWHGYNGGVYFVTICTKNRKHYFGEISVTNKPQMQLSEIGVIANDCMQQIHAHFHVHIVRDQFELNRITEYIENNVAKWQFDKMNIDKKQNK